MFYYAVLRDDEFVLTTNKSEEKDALINIQRQMMGWQNVFPNSKLRIVKLRKRASNPDNTGWEFLGDGRL